jgi:hypothetical protein
MLGIQDSQIHSTGMPTAGNAAAYPPISAQPLQVEPPPPPPHDNVPIGAIVLIALGVLFLLNNLGIFQMRHLGPLFLIGIGLWLAYKRMAQSPAGGAR